MKAILQVGPAQFVVDGATFHLLCRDIQQTLHSLMNVRESDIALTLHVDALERCLAHDAQRLTAAGVPIPRGLRDDDDVARGNGDAGAKEEGRLATAHDIARDTEEGERVFPTHRRGISTAHPPLNIFSVGSFDVAEAVVQELQTRVLELRLFLERCVDDGTVPPLPPPDVKTVLPVFPHRGIPLPLLRLNTYLSTTADVLPDYDVQGHRRRGSLTVTGTSAAPV
jgi:hypothetical protein